MELTECLQTRWGERWVMFRPLVETYVETYLLLRRAFAELREARALCTETLGSMGQRKTDVHPLVDKVKLLTGQCLGMLMAMGLTAKGPKGGGGVLDEDEGEGENDPLAELMARVGEVRK